MNAEVRELIALLEGMVNTPFRIAPESNIRNDKAKLEIFEASLAICNLSTLLICLDVEKISNEGMLEVYDNVVDVSKFILDEEFGSDDFIVETLALKSFTALFLEVFTYSLENGFDESMDALMYAFTLYNTVIGGSEM